MILLSKISQIRSIWSISSLFLKSWIILINNSAIFFAQYFISPLWVFKTLAKHSKPFRTFFMLYESFFPALICKDTKSPKSLWSNKVSKRFFGNIKATLPSAASDFLTISSLLLATTFLSKYTTSSLQSKLFLEFAEILGHFLIN